MSDLSPAEAPAPDAPRSTGQAVLRGFRGRCPSCGDGPLMKGYLKVRDTCPVCDEALHHHRADDGPPYLTLLIVGHIIGPAMLWLGVAGPRLDSGDDRDHVILLDGSAGMAWGDRFDW